MCAGTSLADMYAHAREQVVVTTFFLFICAGVLCVPCLPHLPNDAARVWPDLLHDSDVTCSLCGLARPSVLCLLLWLLSKLLLEKAVRVKRQRADSCNTGCQLRGKGDTQQGCKGWAGATGGCGAGCLLLMAPHAHTYTRGQRNTPGAVLLGWPGALLTQPLPRCWWKALPAWMALRSAGTPACAGQHGPAVRTHCCCCCPSCRSCWPGSLRRSGPLSARLRPAPAPGRCPRPWPCCAAAGAAAGPASRSGPRPPVAVVVVFVAGSLVRVRVLVRCRDRSVVPHSTHQQGSLAVCQITNCFLHD